MSVIADLNVARARIEIKSDWRTKELSQSIPGARWDRDGEVWHLPVSWAGCLALRSTFKDSLVIGPALVEWASNEVATRVEPSMALRDAIDDDEPGGDADLYPYQRAGVKFLITARRAILADDPGAGKSAQAIRALRALYLRGENPFPALIVCPNTMKRVWKREIARWWPGLTVSIVKGSATQRRKALAEPAHVYLINWESLRMHTRLAPYGSIGLRRCAECGGADPDMTEARCEVHERELNKFKWGAVIADECHRAKNPQSRQTRALWGATGDAPIRYGLSGTPIANDVLDLWSILHWVAPSEWPSKTKWVDRLIDVMLNAFGGLHVVGVKADMRGEFERSIYPRLRRMTKEVVLPFLPPIIYERRDIEMGAKQAKAYKQMKNEMIAEIEGELLAAPNQLTQTGRLIQFASSYGELVVNEDGSTDLKLAEPSCKIDAFIDDLEDFGDDSVAVMAVSRQLIELLSARLTKLKIPHGLVTGAVSEYDRDAAIQDFQEGRTRFILFTAAAGGVGITLTKARYLVRLQRPWSRVDDVQAENRVHRIGSEIHENIIIIDYPVVGTIEKRVLQVLDEKEGNFQDVVKDRDLLLKYLRDEDEENGE